MLRQPLLEFLRDKLRAIVGPDELQCALFGDDRSDQLDAIDRADLTLGPQDMNVLGVLNEQGKHPQSAAVHRCIVDKGPLPHMNAMVTLSG